MPFQNDRQATGAYLETLITQRKLSDHTVSNYRRDLNQLIQLAEEKALASLTHLQIRRFVSQLHARGMNPRSIARKLSAWRGFYQWLAEETGLPLNPAESVKAPRRARTLPKALSVEDAVQLVATAPQPRKQADANEMRCLQAMFELLYSSGLRVSELTGLDLRHIDEHDYRSRSWIDLDEQEITVTGKGNKTRVVPVGRAAIEAVRKWLDVRQAFVAGQLEPAHQHALFINKRGHRMTPRLVQVRLKTHARALGLSVNVHPHMLRHSFASHVLQSSGDLRAVQEMLGHASISSTQVYTALDFQHLASIYDRAHPRAKKK